MRGLDARQRETPEERQRLIDMTDRCYTVPRLLDECRRLGLQTRRGRKSEIILSLFGQGWRP